MIKGLLMLMCTGFISVNTMAQQISLPAPKKDSKMTLMESLEKRKSVREFSDKQISDQTMSDLLWAACGVNRPEDKKLTVPSAMNRQDVELFVCRQDGAFRYDAFNNTLTRVTDKDLRPMMAGRQTATAEVPAVLVLVSDKKKFEMIDRDFCDLDAGYVSQNICLACTALGLATVPRAGMPRNEIKKALGLTDTYDVIVNHPVGYPK